MKKSAVIELFGSAAALARALSISDAAVSQWGDEVPALREYQIREILAQREATDPYNQDVEYAQPGEEA